MRIKLLTRSLFFLLPMMSFGQTGIFSNPITDTNPSIANPYTNGQSVDPNITVSGIGMGTGIKSNAGSDRYNATSWSTNNSIKTSDYFEFILTPNAGYKIDFTSFVYTGQASGTGPTSFEFRSSLDNYSSNIGTPTGGGTTISLSGASYQNITTPITFHIYGYNASGSSGTFSINDFKFNGFVSCVTLPTPTATITDATCSNGSNGAIVITNLDSAIEFKMADNDYIDLGSTMLSGKNAFTVEGWIKFNKADIGSRMSLFGQNDVVEFGFMSSTTFDCWTVGGGSVSTALPVSLGDNTWHHVAAVGNGTNLKIYIDGVSVATGGSATTNYGSSTFNTKIGGGVIDATGGSFTGQIKKVGFYSTALSAATITGLAASPAIYTGAEAGLIAAYNFSEGVGTTLAKLPAGTNGTFQNTPEWNYSYSWTKIGVPAFSASTKNISGLSPGQYNLAVSTVGGICPKTTSFTVGSTNTAPTITAMTATACSATAFIVTPVNGTNGVVPAGTTYTWSAPVLSPLASITGGSAQATGQATISQTLTNTTTAVATATYTVTPLSGSCAGSTFTVTVTITPTVPPTATKTDATCALATGSITITSPVPAAGITYTVTGTSPVVAAVTNTTGVFSGLAVGTYTYSVANSGCSISGASSVTISPLLSNNWTTSWSLGTPTVDQNLDFQGNYNLGVDVEGCSCKVNSGAAVVFKTGSTLKITNEVKVLSGTLTFENNASLVQINDAAVNKGDIIYMRKTNSVRSSDYTYWSSPVAGQLLKDVSPSYTSGLFYSFNATIGNWVSEATSNVMEVGKGYIIRGPQSNLPPAPYDASFRGIPNNGPPVSPISIGAAGTSNLIGNPYPSALDADAFLNVNSTMLEGTIYFWTHNTAIQLSNSGTAYVYTSNDYASYNGVGGVATLPALSVATGGLNTTKPSGKIAAGQSFFATSKAAGTAIFNNSMRVGVGGITGDNAQFFKINTTKAKSADAVGKNRIWLNLTNSQGAFKQALVGYVTGATNGYDGRFDGESFDGNTFIDFYSVNQDKNLAIQGRALPFDEADTVPLGYKTTIVGNFTIAIDQTDGFFTTQNVFIEDKLLNTTHDLKEAPYTFSTVKGTFNDRFVLRYTNKTLGALGTQDFTTQQNQVLVSNKNKQIKINTDVETIDKVQVYDLLGKQIYQKTNVDSNELAIADLVSSHQVLVVKTVLQNGQTITKKIIF